MIVFNTSTSYFHENSFHYFKRLFIDEMDPRAKYFWFKERIPWPQHRQQAKRNIHVN
jgi:hypothetical protein